MNIWIVATIYLMDSELETKVFCDENSAWEHACNIAKRKLDLYCDDDNEEDNEIYSKFIDSFSQKKYDDAMDTYNEYMYGLDFELQVDIQIHEHTIKSASDLDIPIAASASVPALPDVPCKQCEKKVNASESHCWYCGVSNPAQA